MMTFNDHLDALFERVKHGDQEHQDWLKNEFEEYKKIFIAKLLEEVDTFKSGLEK